MTQLTRIRISDRFKNQAEMLKVEKKLKTYGDVVDFLLDQYLLQEQIRLSEKMISKQVSEILLENLEPTIEKIYNKTKYIDKNSQITLDMVNHIIAAEGLDMPYAHGAINKPTKVYKLIIEARQKDIENKQVKKNYHEEYDFGW